MKIQLHVVYKKLALIIKDTYRLKINGLGRIYHANTNQKETEMAILISDRADFRTRKVIRNKEEHYTTVKMCILQDVMTILNM